MIIAIIGSMKFYNKFTEVKEILEKQGQEIILPLNDDLPEPVPKDYKLKAMQEFNDNLERSDAVFVMNFTNDDRKNHIGVNTLMEIGMAFNRNKKIYILNSIPEFCKHELEAIGSVIINGDLSKIK